MKMEEIEEFVQKEANSIDGDHNLDDLFDNSDAIDVENEYFVDYDKDDNPILLPKTPTPFEELHCEELDKFLVPIFKEKDEVNSFNGNGVVVDNYLITAAHVANSKKCKKALPYLYFLFEGCLEKVDVSMIIHDGRGAEGELVPDKNGIHDDLIVYKLGKKYNSFKLSEKKAEKDMVLMMKPYKFNNGIVANNQTFDCEVVCRYAKEQENSTEYWTNCCTIHNLLGSGKGDSGSALFRGDTLYGILIRGAIWGDNGRQYDMLDAVYINQIIKKEMNKRRHQIQIKSLYEYIKQVEKIRFPNNTLNNHKVFFRGEAKASWEQEGSLFRGKFETDTYTKEVNVSLEKVLIDAAKTQCPQAFVDCPDAISRMVRMQHYGLPTRLYDVTANPLVALYFACNTEPNEDGKVLFTNVLLTPLGVVNTMALLAESIESYENVVDIEKVYRYCKDVGAGVQEEKEVGRFKKWLFDNVTRSFLFQPVMDNERIRRQQGAMIFCSLLTVYYPQDKAKYEKYCKFDNYVEKMKDIPFVKADVKVRDMFDKKEFLIKAEDKKRLLQELDLIGINEGFVYPEIEHQLRTIKYQNVPKNELPFTEDALRAADEIY